MDKPANWTSEEWKSFIAFTTSNKDIPGHSLDCHKWNSFVIVTHNGNSKVTPDEVREAIIKAGWHEDRADKFMDQFTEYHELLTQYQETMGL